MKRPLWILIAAIAVLMGWLIVSRQKPAPAPVATPAHRPIESSEPGRSDETTDLTPVRAVTAFSTAAAPAGVEAASQPPNESETTTEAIDPTEGLSERERTLYRLRELARADREAALKWARELSNAEDRSEALTAICYAVAEQNPRDALTLAVEHQLQNPANRTVENLTQQWAEQDLAAAQTWVEQLPAGELRDETMARLAFVWSQKSPLDAAHYVVEKLPAGTLQTEAAVSVLHQWAIQDLSAALKWAELFPEGPLRTRALAELEGIRQMRAEVVR